VVQLIAREELPIPHVPVFFLNNIIAMGKPVRAAFGYTPWTNEERNASGLGEEDLDWPRRPMIVPR